MKERLTKKSALLAVTIFSLVMALGPLRATAQGEVDVGISFFNGLSQDPVNIVVGEVVFWYDADGNGPYQVISDTGAWPPFITDGGILFTSPGTFPYHDDNGDYGTVYVTANIPPTVVITNPVNNAVFPAPATFDFAVLATDTDVDGISDVEFYVGTNLVDDVFSEPYSTTVSNLVAGTYVITAIAYDNGGLTATNAISITVGSTHTPPALVATLAGNQMVIAWNTNNATGLSLQSTTNLTSGPWTAVTITPTHIASQLVVTNPISGPRRFFRLSNH